MCASDRDLVVTDPSGSVCSDVIVSNCRVTENGLDADADTQPVLSVPRSEASERDLVSAAHSSPEITAHSSHDSGFLEETHPEINYESISMESHQTDHYSSSTSATDSEKPAEPVLPEDELSTAEPLSAASTTHTNSSKKVTFDLPADPIGPELSQRGLSNRMSYSDVGTLTETSAEDYVSQNNKANSSETSSDFKDRGVSCTLTPESIPSIIIHPPRLSDASYERFSTQSPEEEMHKQQKALKADEEDVREASTGQDQTTAECVTARNDLQMFVKSQYGPEVEEGSRLEPESNEIITAGEIMTSRNDLHAFVKEKYGRDVEDIYDEHYDTAWSQESEQLTDVFTEQQMQNKVPEQYEVEEQRDELQTVRSAREASAAYGVMEAEECGGAEVLTGPIQRLAPLKPARPVRQECGSEECTAAPPFPEPAAGSLADSSVETQSHLPMRLRPLTPQPAEITPPEDTAGCKHQTSADNTHGERETDAALTHEREGQERSTAQICSRQRRDASGTQPDTDNISAADPPADGNTFPDRLLSRSVIPGERFVHACTVLSTVIEESETESPTEPGSEADMNAGVALFSTKLSRPASAREGREDAMVVHKMSLVSGDKQSSFGNHESALDGFRRGDEASPELERRWKSLHSHSEEESTLPPRSYDRGVYTSHFHSAQTQPSALPSETGRGPGNTDWRSVQSEVHGSSESYSGGRSREERTAPGAREREAERDGEQVIRKTVFDSQAQFDSRLMIVEPDDYTSDVFQATRVELIPSPTDLEPDALSPASYSEMDNLVDTLKSMERPVRHRLQRTSSNTPFSSLPPIEEDAPVSPLTPLSPLTPASPVFEPKTLSNGVSSLPVDIGLHWGSPKDMRSPLTMMKEQQFGESPNRGLSLPLRASALNSIVMRRGSLTDLASPEETPAKGLGNGGSSSRLENSFFFQPPENGVSSNRSIFRAASLPEIGPSRERMSSSAKGPDASLSSRFERFSFLASPSNSLSGLAETSRMSVAPPVQHSLQESSSFDHKSTLELYRSLPSETLLKNAPPLGFPRSSSLDGGLLLNDTKGFPVNQTPEPEQNLQLKYRAFPDAYLTKEKEHGKLNPRPGKMLIYDKPGLSGERIEVRGDVVDATPWEFTDTISVRVIRGGWVLYEKPDFKGEKVALDEGDVELSDPFGPTAGEASDTQDTTTANPAEEDEEPRRKRRFVIGSIRRAVRDYSVPEISFFPEENAEGKKVTFRDTSEDSRIFGFPIKANSIIINAGLWLVFAEPFFQGVPRVLEVGGFPNPAAWGVTRPYVASVHPLKIGEPRVENLYEPKIVLYEKPYFTGKSREIYTSMRDFLSRVDRQQSLFMFSAGSIKVISGCWVGYEKEGFRGHQYLLEEGEYHDWRVWGGVNAELRSLRVIQADLSEPLLVLFGMPEDEEKQEEQEERTFEVTEAVADVELFGFGINSRSIHVLSGAWVAYSQVDFSGNQYILEKGFYNNCSDWGSEDNRICSVQPILAAASDGPSFRNEVLLYSELDFQGSCRVCHQNQSCLPESLSVRSCRVVGGSWVLYGGEKFSGSMCVLSEGDYPSLTSMGFPTDCSVRSVKAVPMTFSLPSISLFGLECFEGREVTVDTQISNMQEEGFNTHFLSVRVNSGCWVLCEYSNYRGRQFLLEPIEITNWQKFSSVSCIGSLYPVRQKQRLFRIRNQETGHCVSVQGGVEDMKTGRVVVTEQVEGMSDLWLYQDGLIKNKLARSMSLQVMGNVESGAKVVLWTETRVPVQTWSAQVKGHISSATFPGMLLDIKGGKTYDREHLVIREENEERGSQQWELEFV